MSVCNQQKLLCDTFSFMSHDASILSVTLNLWSQIEWHQGADKDSSEEMKVHLKQSVWTHVLNLQAVALLTAVFHHINVSCVFRQLKIEVPCVCDT